MSLRFKINLLLLLVFALLTSALVWPWVYALTHMALARLHLS